MIRVGNVNIEFLEYHQPEGKDWDRANGDIGSAHICFVVDDMQSAPTTTSSPGARCSTALRSRSPTATSPGSQWAYLRDPDGIQLEIWQYP